MNRRAGAPSAWVVSLALSWFALPSALSAQAGTPTAKIDDTLQDENANTLPWRGTSLSFVQSLNVNSFARASQLSYDPTYGWTFILEPRWYFDKRTYLNIDQRLSIELTDSDTTLYRQRALVSDTVIGVDTKIWGQHLKRLGDIEFKAGGHVILPSSLASQAATVIFGLRGRASAQMSFDHVLHGLQVGVQTRYLHRFMSHDTVEAVQPFPCLAGGVEAVSCAYLDTTTNVRDSLATIVSGALSINEQWTVELLAWLSWSRGANLAPGSFATSTGMVYDLPDTSTTHWRNDRYLVLGIDYAPNDWLSVGASMIDYFSERNPDGTLRSPGKSIDLLVGLSTSIIFDQLYLAASGRKTKRSFTP
jgi:hypothetical protein